MSPAASFVLGFVAEPLNAQATTRVLEFRNEHDDFHVHGREVYWLSRARQSESTFSNAAATVARVPGRRQSHSAPTTNPSITEPSTSNDRVAARPSNPAEPAAPAASAANAVPGLPSLLDTEATRRAIRESARAPSLAGRAAAVSDEPQRTSAQERLGNDVKSAGKGDCMKGEYAGTDMGLLSLPFLALAAARGACAP